MIDTVSELSQNAVKKSRIETDCRDDPAIRKPHKPPLCLLCLPG
jgi:hypothetical protein